MSAAIGRLVYWFAELLVDSKSITKLYGDGAVVCTAAGSTGYYRSMGQKPFVVGTADFGIAASNLYWPPYWSAPRVPHDSEVELRTAASNTKERPIFGYVDGRNGVQLGEIYSMKVRKSRVAAAMILYKRNYDLGVKLRRLWHPPSR